MRQSNIIIVRPDTLKPICIWSEQGHNPTKGEYRHGQYFLYNDGGRAAAGYDSSAGDCVTRAICIATGKPYNEVYDALYNGIKTFAKGRSKAAKKAARGGGRRGTTPRNGVHKRVYSAYLRGQGFTFVPTMSIGSGCKVHLRADELPAGTIICKVSKHLVAVIDGVIMDTYDCSRRGERCVYGYYIKK